jgi:hypothetical protein
MKVAVDGSGALVVASDAAQSVARGVTRSTTFKQTHSETLLRDELVGHDRRSRVLHAHTVIDVPYGAAGTVCSPLPARPVTRVSGGYGERAHRETYEHDRQRSPAHERAHPEWSRCSSRASSIRRSTTRRPVRELNIIELIGSS